MVLQPLQGRSHCSRSPVCSPGAQALLGLPLSLLVEAACLQGGGGHLVLRMRAAGARLTAQTGAERQVHLPHPSSSSSSNTLWVGFCLLGSVQCSS